MSESVRKCLWLVVGALIFIPGLMALRYAPAALRAGRASVMAIHDAHRPTVNIAPLATVTVSPVDALEAGTGTWVTLTWHHPATVQEIDVYNPPDPGESLFRGTVTFQDGSVIPVQAVATAGTPQLVRLPSKAVHAVTYRMDGPHRRAPRPDELKIIGRLN